MKKTITTLAFAVAITSSGCANLSEYQKTYATMAITSQVIDEAHHHFWDPYVDETTDRCDPENNPEIKTKGDFDTCLGDVAQNDKVVAGLEAYGELAGTTYEALKAAEPGGDADLRTKRERLVDAALAALEAMGPSGKKYVDKLLALLKSAK